MIMEKVSGAANGRYVTIGGSVFMYMLENYNLPKDYLKGHRVITHCGSWNAQLVPYAMRLDGEWFISENPKMKHGYRDQATGMCLNSLSFDKKKRLKRQAFIDLYADAYRSALLKEAHNVLEDYTMFTNLEYKDD